MTRVEDLCRDPLRPVVERAFPELPPCVSEVESVFVRAAHPRGSVVVVAYRDERPRAADGATRTGTAVLLDGALLPAERAEELWGELSGASALPESEWPAFLQAIVLQGGHLMQIATLAQTDDLLQHWPEARAFVHANPPGMQMDDAAGAHLRIYSYGRQSERGIDCQSLSRHELVVTREAITVMPVEHWATGSWLFEPCGPELPSR
ncbi:MAG: hypothetical protein M3Y87_29480 [Myxococcota bacterium]|nr:hypothetical protein [Myxococcota bacterium]